MVEMLAVLGLFEAHGAPLLVGARAFRKALQIERGNRVQRKLGLLDENATSPSLLQLPADASPSSTTNLLSSL